MRILILIAAIALSGCDVLVDKPKVWHDDNRFVTCYMSPTMESIHCIPDDRLPDPNGCVPGTVDYDSNSCTSFKNKYTEFR